jgi:hypothetical protein
MLLVIPDWFAISALVFAYSFALLAGGAPERIFAAVFASTWLLSMAIHDRVGEMPLYETVKDTVRLALVIWLAMRFDRWWLLVCGMAALLLVGTDIAGILVSIRPWALGTAVWTWSYLYLLTLTVGTWLSWRSRLGGPVTVGCAEP